MTPKPPTPPATAPTQPKPATPPAATRAPELPELSAADKKALREQARREFRAAERERLEAQAAGKAPPPKAGATAPAPADADQVDPTRTDAQRAADAAAFLRGVVWPIAGLAAWLFGYDLGELTEAMAREDAASWVPLARRYRLVDLAITWAGAPARLIARVKALKTKREVTA